MFVTFPVKTIVQNCYFVYPAYIVYIMKYINKVFLCFSASEIYYSCVNTINCTGKNVTKNLLYALGEADANMYLCSKDIRPGKAEFLRLHIYITCCISLLIYGNYLAINYVMRNQSGKHVVKKS